MKFKKVSTSYDGSPDGLSSEILFRQDSLPCGMIEGSPKPLNLSSYTYYTPPGIPGHSAASSSTSPVANIDIVGRGFPYQQPQYYNNLSATSSLDVLGHRPSDGLSLGSAAISHQQKYAMSNNNYQTTQQSGVHGQYNYQSHYYANTTN